MYSSCYGLSVTQLLERAVQDFPQKEVIYDRTRRMCYQELYDEAESLAAGLYQLGIRKGDRVGVSLPNWHEFVVIVFALARLGAVLVPFNTRYREEEAEYVLRSSGARAIFFPREFGSIQHSEQFLRLKPRIQSLEYLISVRFESEEFLSYRELLDLGDNGLPRVEINPKEDIFTILYTSGTTGKAKGAMLTHGNVVHTGAVSAEYMRCTSDDVFLVAVPLFHVFGMVPSIMSTLAARGRMVLLDVYKAQEALALIEQEKVTVHHGVPTMFILELNHPSFSSYDLSSLRTGIIAAAPCPVEIVRRIREDMGCNICVSYGLTETSATLTMTAFEDDDTLRSETVGRVVRGAEIKIVDENRRQVPIGVIGELACRSFGVMKGYDNLPEATREVIDEEGWFYTGDLASVDEQGYVRIVGRKKEMIIRGGYNIYPREIEEKFYAHPAVMEAAIIGLPDPVLGEISCACIRLKPEFAAVTAEELKAYIRDRVADFKVPDQIFFVDEMPMTASGKIQKTALQRLVKE
jgi:fatty-acyl-CoA synthase